MPRTRSLRSLLLLLWGMALPVQAQEGGLAFLRIGTNAAAQALGDAQVAHSRDAFSTYWNPAGLAAAPSRMAGLALHRWVGDVQTYGLATRLPAGASGGVGLFLTATGSGELQREESPGTDDGLFDAQLLSVGVAYGRAIGPVRAGATVKWITERLRAEQATGVALDLGLQADAFGGRVRLGAAYQNLGKMSRLSTRRVELPRLLRAGVALYPFRILTSLDDTPILNTFVAFEVSHQAPSRTTRYHMGVSAEVMELVVLRAGYITNDDLRDLTFGGGLAYGHFVVDYTLLPFEDGFGGPGHILTLTYGW